MVEKIFLRWDSNEDVGSVSRGFEGLHGGYGLGKINAEEESILDFSSAFDVIIANMCFRKRKEHLITYKSEVICFRIDFFLIRKSDRKICLDCKVILRENLTIHHRVLVMDVRIKSSMKRISHIGAPWIKWWHLKHENKGFSDTRSYREVLGYHKGAHMICDTK